MSGQGVADEELNKAGTEQIDQGTPQPHTKYQLDIVVDRVRRAAGEFAVLPIDERIKLAREMQQGYLGIAERSVAVACAAKGVAPGTPTEGEEWATGPMPVVRHLRLIREQLSAIRRTGTTRMGKTGTTTTGKLTARVFPASAVDALLFKDVTVDVHLQGHVDQAVMEFSRARFYKRPYHQGRVVLVLGAGNLAMIPVMDVLTLMFNEGKACILKMSPVNAYLGPLLEEAFAPAIERGYMAIVHGGVEAGDYLIRQDGIDEVHITGSDRSYDTILWGPSGPERERRKQAGAMLVRKRVNAELGNVSPIIIAPAAYTEKELRFMAEDIVGYFAMNSSFLCCAAKIMITPRGWDQRARFLDLVAEILKGAPLRSAYYPGTAERYKAFTKDRQEMRQIGTPDDGALPWALLSALDPEAEEEPFFRQESFCPVLGETAVGSTDPVEFLAKAVDFANDRLWGTLSATLMIPPKLRKKGVVNLAVERAIERLRYGTVAVNGFPGMSFAFGSPPWGAFPGSKPEDIQSGFGWVHNTAMLEGIEKAVVRFPFISFPKPVYHPSHRTVHQVMRKMTLLEEDGSWSKVPGVVLAALRG